MVSGGPRRAGPGVWQLQEGLAPAFLSEDLRFPGTFQACSQVPRPTGALGQEDQAQAGH